MFAAVNSTSNHNSIAYVYVDELADMEYTTIYVINSIEESYEDL
jgi:hypothetical protein